MKTPGTTRLAAKCVTSLSSPNPDKPALNEQIRHRAREQWLKENGPALDAYNDHVKKYGVFSDGLRGF